MEILSDTTFRGHTTFERNVTFNKLVTINNSELITGSLITRCSTIEGKLGVDGNFSFTPIDEPRSPILEIRSYTNNSGVKYNSVSISGNDVSFGGNVSIGGPNTSANIERLNVTEINIENGGYGKIILNNVSISSWDELKGCQCHILRFRNPTIPASCNTFYFVNPDGSNAIIPNPGVSSLNGSISEFFITQVYSGLGDNFGKVVQMETSLEGSSDGSGFNLIGTIASHNEEISVRSYVAVVNV